MAVEKICQMMNISSAETIAFGDYLNDISMIERCGIGVAMGNALDEVKSASTYVSDHSDNGGIRKACLHFKIIEE